MRVPPRGPAERCSNGRGGSSAGTRELPDAPGRFRQERLDRAVDHDEAEWAAHVVLLGPSPIGLAVVREP